MAQTKTNRVKAKAAAAPAPTARRQINVPPPAPTTQALIAGQKPGDQEPTESGVKLTVLIPKNFTLTLDNHTSISYKAGTDEIPEEHARHWWAVAQGVKVVGEEDEED